MNRRLWLTAASLAAAVLFGTLAQAETQKKSGNIVSTDWGAMTMDIKEKTGVGTWKVARDCSVRFLDQKEKFRNPTLSDLKAPMYVNFYFERDSDRIDSIEVVDIGFKVEGGGPGAQQQAVVTNLDENVGHIEVMTSPGGIKTFTVDPKLLAGVKKGDKVTLLIENRNGQEWVTGIRVDAGGPGAQQQAVVTNLDENVGHIEVMMSPGGIKTFAVDPKRLLVGVKKGDKVTLLIENRNGQEWVTGIKK
jgi:Cu/Ag efflux protein CusF